MITLDRKKKYAEIHGHSIARFYQDGKYFNGRGEQVQELEAAKPAGLTQRQLEELRNENIDSDENLAGDEPTAVPAPEVATEAAPSPPPAEPEADPAPEPEEAVTEDAPAKKDPVVEEHYADMVKLHHTAVTAMTEDLKAQMIEDGTDPDTLADIPFTGEGAKKKNARWVAEHLE